MTQRDSTRVSKGLSGNKKTSPQKVYTTEKKRGRKTDEEGDWLAFAELLSGVFPCSRCSDECRD